MTSTLRAISASVLLVALVLCGSTPTIGAVGACTGDCGFVLNGDPESPTGAPFSYQGKYAGSHFIGDGRLWTSRTEGDQKPVGIIVAPGWGVNTLTDPDLATFVGELRSRLPGLVIIAMNLTHVPGYQGTPPAAGGTAANAKILALQATLLKRFGVQPDQTAIIGQNKGGSAAVESLSDLGTPPCTTVLAGTGGEANSPVPPGNQIFMGTCSNDTVVPTQEVEALSNTFVSQKITTALTIYDDCESQDPHGSLLRNERFLTNTIDLIYKACS